MFPLSWSVIDRSERPSRMHAGADKVLAALLLAGLTLPTGISSASEVEYDFVLVEAFELDYDLREVNLRDINESGLVCGTATHEGFYDGFVWTAQADKVIVPMIWPAGINNLNQIVSDGRIYDYDTGATINVPAAGQYPVPRLQGINDNEVAVGYSECSCSNSDHTIQDALVWDPVLGSRTIPIPAAKELLRINNSDVAVGNIRGGSAGTEGFVYNVDNGDYVNMTDLLPPYLYGRGPSELLDINELGVVTGRGWDGTYRRGLTWSEMDGFTFLPAIPGGLIDRVYPRGINAAGTVVGFADLTLHNPRAFVWDPVHGMRNLNDLTVAPPNFILDWATKINDQGWIIGIGHYGPNWGSSRGFVLKPIGDSSNVDDAAFNINALEMRVLPNPVVDRMALRVGLPGSSPARIAVFDVMGREVSRIFDGSLLAGLHDASWIVPLAQPGGVYYARLTTPRGALSQPFILLR